MTGFVLDANITGTAQRTQLNTIIAALNTCQRGTSRPANAAKGTLWVDSTGGDTANLLKAYDGSSADTTLGTINFTAATFTPSGQLATFANAITNKTGTFTADNTHYGKVITCDATSASFTANITAPGSLTAPWYIIIEKTDSTAHTITITPASGTVNGASTYVVNSQFTGVILILNGSNFNALPYGASPIQIQWSNAGGTADAITATYGVPNAALTDGLILGIRAGAANATTTPTFSPDSLTAHTITKMGGAAVAPGDIPGNLAECLLRYNLANTRWEILNPASFAQRYASNTFTGAQLCAQTAITSTSAHIATNLALNNVFTHTFTENTTLDSPTNIVAGQSGSIQFIQHASSPKTLAFGSNWKFPNGTVPVISAVNSAKDTLYYNVRTSTVIEANLVKGFA